jgi:hypothetical protein
MDGIPDHSRTLQRASVFAATREDRNRRRQSAGFLSISFRSDRRRANRACRSVGKRLEDGRATARGFLVFGGIFKDLFVVIDSGRKPFRQHASSGVLILLSLGEAPTKTFHTLRCRPNIRQIDIRHIFLMTVEGNNLRHSSLFP